MRKRDIKTSILIEREEKDNRQTDRDGRNVIERRIEMRKDGKQEKKYLASSSSFFFRKMVPVAKT